MLHQAAATNVCWTWKELSVNRSMHQYSLSGFCVGLRPYHPYVLVFERYWAVGAGTVVWSEEVCSGLPATSLDHDPCTLSKACAVGLKSRALTLPSKAFLGTRQRRLDILKERATSEKSGDLPHTHIDILLAFKVDLGSARRNRSADPEQSLNR